MLGCDDDDLAIQGLTPDAGASGRAGAAADDRPPARGRADAAVDGDGSAVGTCRGIALPQSSHYVLQGLCARAVAFDQGRLRQIAFAANGDLVGVRVSGEVVRYRDLDEDGMFAGEDEVVVIADTGGNGNNAHIDEEAGFLYAGSPDGVVRFPYSTEAGELGPAEPVISGQPSSGVHPYHTVHVYGGFLYVHSGSESNLAAPRAPLVDAERSVLKRFPLASFDPAAPWGWSEGEVVVTGIRNMVGFASDPRGRLYGVVNGIDDLLRAGEDVHLDNPGDDLIRIEPGASHGYPYCFTAQRILGSDGLVRPGTQLAGATEGWANPHDDAWCAENSREPVSFLPAHTAPLDIVFAGDSGLGGLPDELRSGAFISLHGSWNTTPSVGYAVVFLPFENGTAAMPGVGDDGPVFPFTVVFGGGSSAGHVDGVWGWEAEGVGESVVRPVGVAISPRDGTLFVSSDGEGVIYRIGRALE